MLPCKSCSAAYLSGAYTFNPFPNLGLLTTSKLLFCLALHSLSPLAELRESELREAAALTQMFIIQLINSVSHWHIQLKRMETRGGDTTGKKSQKKLNPFQH